MVAATALLALVGASAGNTPPGLNHAYVVLDRATFDAIRDSASLAAILGPSDAGLPAYPPPDAKADRLFLRGRQTYLELFAPENRFDEPPGKVGIGIGVDTRTGFRRIETGWRRACGAGLTRDTVAWTRASPPVPWYEVLSCKATASGDALVVWAMLYRPEFHRWQSGSEDGAARVSRRALLAARGAAGQGRFEVTGLTLDVAPPLHRRMVGQLASAGFRRVAAAGGTRLVGGGWSLTLRPVRGPAKLRAIDLRTDALGAARVELGEAVLVKSGKGTARLRFD